MNEDFKIEKDLNPPSEEKEISFNEKTLGDAYETLKEAQKIKEKILDNSISIADPIINEVVEKMYSFIPAFQSFYKEALKKYSKEEQQEIEKKSEKEFRNLLKKDEEELLRKKREAERLARIREEEDLEDL